MRDKNGRFTKKQETSNVPKLWRVKITHENREKLEKYRQTLTSLRSSVNCLHKDALDKWLVNDWSDGTFMAWSNLTKGSSLDKYTELTMEEFETLILKEEKEFKLPEKWCLAVTPKTKGIVESWRTDGRICSTGGYVLSQGHSRACNPRAYGYYVKTKPEDTPEITFEQFKKYVLKEEEQPEKKRYTLEELLFDPEIIVFLENEDQHAHLRDALRNTSFSDFQGLYTWNGACCYSLNERTYSSTSSKTNKGDYAGERTIVTFDQIKFKTDMKDKKIIGYNFKPSMKQYEQAALTIANASRWNTLSLPNITLGCMAEEYLRKANVLDLWFDPVYEDDIPQVEIRGHTAAFGIGINSRQNIVTFGCQKFTKAEVLNFVDILDRSGLIIDTYNPQVRKVAEYFKKQK